MLHKASKIRGFHLLATDGEIGHVDDVLIDERTWSVRYLVVDTSNWIGGKSVLISPATLRSVDAVHRKIQVALTRDAIKRSPSIEVADIDPAETIPTVWIM